MIETMSIKPENMLKQAKLGHLAATDVADYLAKRGLPFRHAHEVVGHLVLLCEQRGCNLDDLSFDDFKAASPLFKEDIVKALDLPSIVAARTTEGGTGEAAVTQQVEKAKAALAAAIAAAPRNQKGGQGTSSRFPGCPWLFCYELVCF